MRFGTREAGDTFDFAFDRDKGTITATRTDVNQGWGLKLFASCGSCPHREIEIGSKIEIGSRIKIGSNIKIV